MSVAYWVLKAVFTPVLVLLWRVRREGRHLVPSHGAAILAANHQSFCDSFFLPLAVPRRVTFLAKAEYFDSWRTAWFFRAVGQIPIRRSGGDESERALATAREVLRVGQVLGVYPEGTRSPNDCVHKGRTGVARLALECEVPVVPVGILGTTEVQPVGHRLWRPGRRVTIRFGAPMRVRVPAGATEAEQHAALREFTDHLMQEIARLSGRTYLHEYVPGRSPGVPTVDSSSERNRPFTQSA